MVWAGMISSKYNAPLYKKKFEHTYLVKEIFLPPTITIVNLHLIFVFSFFFTHFCTYLALNSTRGFSVIIIFI